MIEGAAWDGTGCARDFAGSTAPRPLARVPLPAITPSRTRLCDPHREPAQGSNGARAPLRLRQEPPALSCFITKRRQGTEAGRRRARGPEIAINQLYG